MLSVIGDVLMSVLIEQGAPPLPEGAVLRSTGVESGGGVPSAQAQGGVPTANYATTDHFKRITECWVEYARTWSIDLQSRYPTQAVSSIHSGFFTRAHVETRDCRF